MCSEVEIELRIFGDLEEMPESEPCNKSVNL